MTIFNAPDVPRPLRRLVVICGDQLDAGSAVFDGFDPAQDALLMTEAAEEARYLPQHKRRLAFFFAAMRHFARDQAELGRPLLYHRLDAPNAPPSLSAALERAAAAFEPAQIVMTRPGDWRVKSALEAAAGGRLRYVADRHFIADDRRFESLRSGRKRFILEDYYRAERQRTGWLMEGDAPIGGQWNFDKENRRSFGRDGPGLAPPRASFAPDALSFAPLGGHEREIA